MIRTVTFNPAIDQTVTLADLTPGEVHRAAAVRQDPGGKGVNVASCLADWGVPVTVHGLLGSANAGIFADLFAAKGIADAMIRVPGDTRTNIKILETGQAAGRTTDLNLPGFSARPGDGDRVRDTLCPDAGEIVVISGSHPAGLGDDASARLVAALAERGARIVLDVSGAALAAALAAPVLPYAVKPNRQELEAWAGRELADRAALVETAQALIARGIKLVGVSLGTEGAVFVSAEGVVQAVPPALSAGSTVGAGDAMVAGLAAGLAEGLGLEALARQATAFAAGKLRHAGPHLPPADQVRALAAAVDITTFARRAADAQLGGKNG